jgi:DNA replication protein DnaC
MLTHPLLPKLRQLRLGGMVLTLEVRATQAIDGGLSPVEFLALLLDDELERRDQRRLSQRLAHSGCEARKTLSQFDFAAAPGVNRSVIHDLATCAFVARHENVLLCGPTGVGKTHLANALALEALKRNYRVLSRPTHRLLADFQAARASGTHARLLTRILTCDLLVLDDFGLQPTSAQGAQDLYDIVSERYEHASLILTSNRAFDEWAEPFGNSLLASAALDRLTHHAHTLIIRGQSYRQRQRRKEEPLGAAVSPADPTSLATA